MRNTEMFTRIMNQISDHPETHNQASWEWAVSSCGTTRCVAGWALHFWGVDQGFGHLDLDYLRAEYVKANPAVRCWPSAGATYVEIGADILGLENSEAHHLFVEIQDQDEAFDLVSKYAHGEL